MTKEECKAMIKAIDALLDNDSISDAEYDALDAKAREFTQMLAVLERAERTAELPQISNSFVMDVCEGFAVGTHIITTRQYDTIRRISRCSEFCCDGYVINIAPGRTFCHLIKSKIR